MTEIYTRKINFILKKDLSVYLAAGLLLLALLAAVGDAAPHPFKAARVLLGLALVLFLPGYLLQMAVFPRRADLDIPERLALSFGLSLALIPLIVLLLHNLHVSISLWPILFAEGSLILLFSTAANLRNRWIPPEERLQPLRPSDLRLWVVSLERKDRRLLMVLTGAVLTAFLSAAVILSLPSAAGSYTEFYLLGPEGLAEKFPREVRLDEDLNVTFGITSHERKVKTYRVEVSIQDVQSAEKQLVAAAGPFTLQPGETVERAIQWQMLRTGSDQQVDFLLLVEGSPEPYRSLFLVLNVNER